MVDLAAKARYCCLQLVEQMGIVRLSLLYFQVLAVSSRLKVWALPPCWHASTGSAELAVIP